MTAIAESEFRAYANRVEQMVEQVNAIADAAARNVALELLQSVMDLHGAAFARMVELLESDRAAIEQDRRRSAALRNDGALRRASGRLGGARREGRCERASATAQAQRDGGGRRHRGGRGAVKIESSGHGCGSSTDAIADVVQQAILESAPEVVEVAIEGAAAPPDLFRSTIFSRQSRRQAMKNPPRDIDAHAPE